MQRTALRLCVFLLISVLASFFAGCDSPSAAPNASDGQRRETLTSCLVPDASGSVTYGSDAVSIDASHTDEGYVMVCCQDSDRRVKMQITLPNAVIYTYTLNPGAYESFPLPGGDGSYHLEILENVSDDRYALLYAQDISVSLSDSFKPFLYPNQYVWYTPDSQTVAFARDLSAESSSDLDYVSRVYYYVIQNITYDTEAAKNITTGYIPDIDATFSTGKGICFDYAALMSAMLRSQGIPTRLEVGYSGPAYHAWISVYLDEIGWVDKIIEFDGHSWSLMDPTLASGNDRKEVQKYIGDSSNYTVKYSY